MKFTILTLFPEMFSGPFDQSILKRAQERNLLSIEFKNIRDFGIGKHKVVDDTPYGGGRGMVLRVDVLHAAIEATRDKELQKEEEKVILLSAKGKTFTQSIAHEYAHLKHLIILCGHYEGVDERIKHFIDEEVSIGDFVVTGGEIPAMLIVDAVGRLVPEVLKDGVTENETFSPVLSQEETYIEHPHYTKPPTYNNLSVPEVLLSGNHAHIKTWRTEQSSKK